MRSLLPYGTGICHYVFIYLKKKKKSIVSVRSFLISGIDKLEWSMIPACHSFMCSFNRGNIEGTNSENLCLMFSEYMFCFMFAK